MTTSFRFMLFGAAGLAAAILVAGCNKAVEPNTAPLAAASVDLNVSDADVTTNVKTALLQHSALAGFDIGVATTKGDVRLNGVLDNQAQVDMAVATARAASGVHAIHDELSIKK